MTDEPFTNTIDWERHWADDDTNASPAATPSAEFVAAPLLEFLDTAEPIDSYADVGCGPGGVVFDVAEAYPDATVIGFDAAESILEGNRERAREREVPNLAFDRTVLPSFDPGRSFDVISCVFTLCYVADVEAALRSLYDAVAPGGALVITYHNRYARSVFRDIAAAPHEALDDTSRWDPEHFEERFAPVLSGESLLSYEAIHDTLGTWPQSLWSAVDADRYGAWRQNPLVFVPKAD